MVSIFAKTSIFRGNTQVHLQFLCNQNFSRLRKTELLRKWMTVVLQAKFRFMGCLVKANALVLRNIALSLSSQLIVLVFMKQPSAERYLANFFRQYFCELFENCSSASNYVPKCFRAFTKSHPCPSLMLVKLQAFTGEETGAFCKKVFTKFSGKGLCQRLYFNKVAFLGL